MYKKLLCVAALLFSGLFLAQLSAKKRLRVRNPINIALGQSFNGVIKRKEAPATFIFSAEAQDTVTVDLAGSVKFKLFQCANPEAFTGCKKLKRDPLILPLLALGTDPAPAPRFTIPETGDYVLQIRAIGKKKKRSFALALTSVNTFDLNRIPIAAVPAKLGNGFEPQISGDSIAWTEGDKIRVFTANGNEVSTLTKASEADEFFCGIDLDDQQNIVWQQGILDGFPTDSFLRAINFQNLNSASPSSATGLGFNPQISGEQILYTQDVNSNIDLGPFIGSKLVLEDVSLPQSTDLDSILGFNFFRDDRFKVFANKLFYYQSLAPGATESSVSTSLKLVDLSDLSVTNISNETGFVEFLDIDGDILAWSVFENGITKIFVFDTNTQEKILIAESEARIVALAVDSVLGSTIELAWASQNEINISLRTVNDGVASLINEFLTIANAHEVIDLDFENQKLVWQQKKDNNDASTFKSQIFMIDRSIPPTVDPALSQIKALNVVDRNFDFVCGDPPCPGPGACTAVIKPTNFDGVCQLFKSGSTLLSKTACSPDGSF